MKRFFLLLCLTPFLHAHDYQFFGTHFIASYKECDLKALTDLDALRAVMQQAASDSGASVLEAVHKVFEPDGLTLVILLSESHASIHTYPEHNACFVDLFTCGSSCSYEAFDAAIQRYLRPAIVEVSIIPRG